MIQELFINNFQSHKKSHLVFTEGLNVIVGKTDSGKTGIIRALRLVVENLPAGDAYRSNWGGDTSVIALFDNCTVERGRTNSSNYYKLGKTEFTAFGRAVPEEIQQAINFDETSIQKQLDSPFLLSETAGAVAAHFNDVGGLSIIDKAESSIKKSINETNSSITFLTQTIAEEVAVCNTYDYLKDMERAICKIEELEKEYEAKQTAVKGLEESIAKAESIRLDIRNFSKITTCEDIDILLQAHTDRKNKMANIEEFSIRMRECTHTKHEIEYSSKYCDSQLLNELLQAKAFHKEAKNKIYSLEESVTSLEGVGAQLQQMARTVQDTTLLETLIVAKTNRQALFAKGNAIQAVYIALRKLTKDTQAQEALTKELETTYEEEFPNICPLCNSKKHGKN